MQIASSYPCVSRPPRAVPLYISDTPWWGLLVALGYARCQCSLPLLPMHCHSSCPPLQPMHRHSNCLRAWLFWQLLSIRRSCIVLLVLTYFCVLGFSLFVPIYFCSSLCCTHVLTCTGSEPSGHYTPGVGRLVVACSFARLFVFRLVTLLLSFAPLVP